MKIRLESLGCRLNLGELDALARSLARDGHIVVGPGEDAEICILNTCTVTGMAAKKSRQAIRRLRRALPDASLVLTGCFAELSKDVCKDLGADLVVPNAQKDLLKSILKERKILNSGARCSPLPTIPAISHTRAFLKVQDGCNNHCTFCIVTRARGESKSRRISDVLDDILHLEDEGFREIVISGVHLGSWGRDFPQQKILGDLIQAILKGSQIERIRLSSLEPWDLDEDFFDLFSDHRMLPHLHLPLQSGSARILKKMARKTNPEAFGRLLETARSKIPDVAVSTDVIVGFPGETNEDFMESLAFIKAMDFSRIHVFRFSAREGTAAASMPGKVHGQALSERARILHETAHRCGEDFCSRFIGREMPVLWEDAEERENGRLWSGLTPNYIRVITSALPEEDLLNHISLTRLEQMHPGAVKGRILSGY